MIICCTCFPCAAGSSRSRRRHTVPHRVTTNVQPAATTTAFTTPQNAQGSTLPPQESYPAAYPTAPQQPLAPFVLKPDSVLYPQEAPPPYPGNVTTQYNQQFSPYPQQPVQAYPGITAETGTAPYPTVDPGYPQASGPAYPPPTDAGYPPATGEPSGYPATGEPPGYPATGEPPGYPPTSGEPPSYPATGEPPSYPATGEPPSYPATGEPGYPLTGYQ